MAQVNPNPHKPGYQFLPQRCVTALFAAPSPVAAVVAELRNAGFAESDVQAFIGEEGARQLDVDADKQSTATKLLQALTKALADDASYLERAAGILREGGALVAVSADEEAAVGQAASILKAHGGSDVQHWGEWTTEQL